MPTYDTPKPCGHCGKVFRPQASSKGRNAARFCSYPCSNAARGTVAERLLRRRRIDPITGCWLWTGGKSKGGYGAIRVEGVQQKVHRVSAHVYTGFDLASPLFICHTCDTRACFHPAHLFSGTPADNIQDAVSKDRMNKPKGTLHPMVKLTEADVLEIRRVHATGVGLPPLAERFSVSCASICNIVNRKSWKHLP